MIKELSDKDFIIDNNSVYLKTKGPGMILLWAKWCGHCHNFLPSYAKLDEKIGNGFVLTSMEEYMFGTNPELANTLGIRGFPTIKFFNEQGKIVTDYSGARDLQSLLSYICKFYHHCSI